VFKKYDLSGDGSLDFKEFGVIFTQKTQGADDDQIPSPAKRNDPYLQEKQRQQLTLASTKTDSPDALLRLFKDKIRARGARGIVGL